MINKKDLKLVAEGLIDTFKFAGTEAIRICSEGLKIEIKADGSPVSNGDLRVNELITKKISELTPNIPIVSEETVNMKIKNNAKQTPGPIPARNMLKTDSSTTNA